MKIKKSAYQISDVVNISSLDPKHLDVFKIFSLPFWLVVISIGFSCASQSVRAGTEDADLYYRYVPYQGPSSTTGTGSQAAQQSSGASSEAKQAEQSTSTGEKGGGAGQEAAGQSAQQSNAPKTESAMPGEHNPPVQRPERGTGEFPSATIPSFTEIDVNGDHYITKDELQNFPELLRVFDKIDAGKDGKLEQHEFANLEMETSREGEF
ncbi:MAG: EF-hand domain-containing protein [Methylobacter sp.]